MKFLELKETLNDIFNFPTTAFVRADTFDQTHHPRHIVGMRHTTFRLADCEEAYQKADIIARSVAYIKNPYFLKIP